ncbi:MAG: VTT domain-containing protein, partial [Gammaproteobacteria bacterium]|nr:VTT domain-containing protein [Gammaproteobacteria bacterium]
MNKTVLRGLLAALVIAAIAVAVSFRDQLNAEALEQWVASAGLAGPLLFMLIYAIGTVLFLPGSVLTLTGGAIFGPVWGTLYNLTGATLGATLAFLIARHLAAEWVERKSGGRLKQIKNGVESEGWRFVAFVRLVPLFPFNVLNYALGLTRIRLSHYLIASYLCMLPGALAYTYLGYAGREAVAGGEGAIQKGLLALALLATVAFLPRLVSRMRQGPMIDASALKTQLDRDESPLVLDVRSVEEYRGEPGHIQGALNIPLPELAQ